MTVTLIYPTLEANNSKTVCHKILIWLQLEVILTGFAGIRIKFRKLNILRKVVKLHFCKIRKIGKIKKKKVGVTREGSPTYLAM